MPDCKECEHPLSFHFKDVTGVVRCTFTERGVSTRGILGIPYETHCDCIDYHSETVSRFKAKKAEEKRVLDEQIRRSLESRPYTKLSMSDLASPSTSTAQANPVKSVWEDGKLVEVVEIKE